VQAEIADIRRRAEAGDAEATAFTAVLAGMGVGEPQNWSAALERLRRAAEAGSRSAEAQLGVLAEAQGPGLELSGWTAPAERQRLLTAPRISAARGFLTPGACRWLIGRAAGRIAPAMVFDPDAGGARRESGRSNSAFEFPFLELDLVIVAVRAKIAATVGVPPQALEPPQVLHYAPGETFERHYDFLDPQVPGYAADVARRGQRIATFLIYLNTDYAGGETDFPMVGLSFKGETGDGLMFANIDPEGRPDRQTLHAGLPPTTGEKWLFSQWVRDRAPM
jgi:prolyl 4-hydroxylase